jgi:hypothetical protein
MIKMFGIELVKTVGDYSLLKWGVEYLVVFDFHVIDASWSWGRTFYNMKDASVFLETIAA